MWLIYFSAVYADAFNENISSIFVLFTVTRLKLRFGLCAFISVPFVGYNVESFITWPL